MKLTRKTVHVRNKVGEHILAQTNLIIAQIRRASSFAPGTAKDPPSWKSTWRWMRIEKNYQILQGQISAKFRTCGSISKRTIWSSSIYKLLGFIWTTNYRWFMERLMLLFVFCFWRTQPLRIIPYAKNRVKNERAWLLTHYTHALINLSANLTLQTHEYNISNFHSTSCHVQSLWYLGTHSALLL